MQVTGSGITLGLVYLMSRSKCKSFNSMGKVVILPSLFGINEPVIFGTPIVMNPYMFVPFVFGPVLVGALNFMALKVGLVGLPIAEPPGFLLQGLQHFDDIRLEGNRISICKYNTYDLDILSIL